MTDMGLLSKWLTYARVKVIIFGWIGSEIGVDKGN